MAVISTREAGDSIPHSRNSNYKFSHFWMSQNSMQRALPSQYQGTELAFRPMLWLPVALVELQNTASFVRLRFKVTVWSWHRFSLVITDSIWQFWGEILTSPAVFFSIITMLLLLNAELAAHPVSCMEVAIVPLSTGYNIARWVIVGTGIFLFLAYWYVSFSVLSFFEVKYGEKLGEFSHITTFDDLFMEIPHTSEKELTFGPGTCLLPTWWKLKQSVMLKNHGLRIHSGVFFGF